jgi:hypothetical protein
VISGRKFKVSDIVEAYGVRGMVYDSPEQGKILVRFDSGQRMFFSDEGLQAPWHKTPSLVLITDEPLTSESDGVAK